MCQWPTTSLVREGVGGGSQRLLGLGRSWCSPSTTPRVWEGFSGGLRALLASGWVAVEVCNCPWAGSVLPSGSTHTGKKGYSLGPTSPLLHHPNNADWPLRRLRLPPLIPPAVVALDSSPRPPVCLYTANPSPLPGSDLWSPSSSTQPLPALGMCVSGWGVQVSLCSGCHKLTAAFFSEALKLPFCPGRSPCR